MAQSRDLRLPVLCLFALTLVAAPLRAQEPAPSATSATTIVSPAPAAAPVASGPTLDAGSVAVRRPVTESLTMAPVAAGGSHSQGTTLMIVGGAAILTGLVVGTDAGHAISVAGAVVGLYGLYLYLQ